MGTKYMPWDLCVERGADRGQKLGLIVARDTRSATVAHVKYSPEKKGERKTRRLPGGSGDGWEWRESYRAPRMRQKLRAK